MLGTQAVPFPQPRATSCDASTRYALRAHGRSLRKRGRQCLRGRVVSHPTPATSAPRRRGVHPCGFAQRGVLRPRERSCRLRAHPRVVPAAAARDAREHELKSCGQKRYWAVLDTESPSWRLSCGQGQRRHVAHEILGQVVLSIPELHGCQGACIGISAAAYRRHDVRLPRHGEVRYLQICRSERVRGGSPRRIVLGSLGNVDHLSEEQIDALIVSLSRFVSPEMQRKLVEGGAGVLSAKP